MPKVPLLLILLISFSSCVQEKECSDFRTGSFIYLNKNRPEKITRTDSIQIESNPVTGVVIYSGIQWTAPCNYVLTYEKILNHPDDLSHMIGKKIYVEILETKRDRMRVQVKSDEVKMVMSFLKK